MSLGMSLDVGHITFLPVLRRLWHFSFANLTLRLAPNPFLDFLEKIKKQQNSQ